LSELAEHVVEEEGEPDAFAFAFRTHFVHAVIPIAAPHEGQSVCAEAESVFNGAHAVVVETGAFLRDVGLVEIGFFIGGNSPAFEEGYAFIQHPAVADAAHVVAGDKGEPEVVVGEVGAHSASAGRMPPVLHIAFDKLMGGGEQQMSPDKCGFTVHQGETVL
jgi:hypothetical protein